MNIPSSSRSKDQTRFFFLFENTQSSPIQRERGGGGRDRRGKGEREKGGGERQTDRDRQRQTEIELYLLARHRCTTHSGFSEVMPTEGERVTQEYLVSGVRMPAYGISARPTPASTRRTYSEASAKKKKKHKQQAWRGAYCAYFYSGKKNDA